MVESATSTTLLEKLAYCEMGQRNEDAWRRFVELYCPLVYRLARKKGLNREEAEQLFQELCFSLVRRMPSFRYDPERGRFRDWLLTITLNLIRRHWRSSAARERLARAYVQHVAEPNVNGNGSGKSERPLEQWWRDHERIRALQLAVDRAGSRVSSRDLDIFKRVVLERQPVADVAAEHGISANTLYGIKHRVLLKVRELAHEIEAEWR